MTGRLVDIIISQDAEVRDQSLGTLCKHASMDGLLAECAALEAFRRTCDNHYERVRALFFLYAYMRKIIHESLPAVNDQPPEIPY